MANHRADGRALVRKHRVTGGTHRDATLPAGVVKVGVLGALATATIAAPLAAAAAGIEDAADPTASATAATSVTAPTPAEDPAPVALPVAAVVETRADEDTASRSDERDAADEDAATEEDGPAADAGDTGIEIALPEPEPVAADPAAPAAAAEGSAPASSTGYVRPVDGAISSGYGYRTHPVLGYSKLHDGVDFAASCGTPVASAASGTVVAVEYHHASGNRVKVDHGDGVVTGYYHLQGFAVGVGDTVTQGETIGYVGTTGRSTGCHLHFAKMDEAGSYSDPMSLLR